MSTLLAAVRPPPPLELRKNAQSGQDSQTMLSEEYFTPNTLGSPWMDHILDRRLWMCGLATAGATFAGFNGNAWSAALARPVSTTLLMLGDAEATTCQYALELQADGSVTLGQESDPKQVAFTVITRQQFAQRPISTAAGRMASRLYQRAELVKRFGALEPETVAIGRSPLAVLAFTEAPESGRMEFRSQERPLTQAIVNMLQKPLSPLWLDPMADLMLDGRPKLEVGNRLELPDDLVAKLVCLEEISEHSLVCTVDKANDTQAVATLSGDVNGRSLDVTSKLRLNASLRIIYATTTVTQVRASYHEKREKGVISPAFSATTRLKLDQSPASQPIPQSVIDRQLQLLQTPGHLTFTSASNRVELQHTGQWHLVLDQPGAIIWRLIIGGEVLMQCNLLLPTAPSTQALSISEFAREVEASLSESSGQVVGQQRISGAGGSEVLRVQAVGKEEEIDLAYVYYLVTAPNGRQAQLVFTTEAGFKEAVGQSDRLFAETLIMRESPVANSSSATTRQ